MRPRFRFNDKPLGRILVDKGKINSVNLDAALMRQQENPSHLLLGQLLIELGLIKEEDVLEALSSQYRFAYVPANRYSIRPEIFSCVPHEVSRQHGFIPVDKFGDMLVVAMANPFCAEAWAALRSHWQGKVEICISTSLEIEQAFKEVSSPV